MSTLYDDRIIVLSCCFRISKLPTSNTLEADYAFLAIDFEAYIVLAALRAKRILLCAPYPPATTSPISIPVLLLLR